MGEGMMALSSVMWVGIMIWTIVYQGMAIQRKTLNASEKEEEDQNRDMDDDMIIHSSQTSSSSSASSASSASSSSSSSVSSSSSSSPYSSDTDAYQSASEEDVQNDELWDDGVLML